MTQYPDLAKTLGRSKNVQGKVEKWLSREVYKILPYGDITYSRYVGPDGTPDPRKDNRRRNIAHGLGREIHDSLEPLDAAFRTGCGDSLCYALMSASLLATRYDFVCQIETLMSDTPHSYFCILAHEGRRVIFDIWANHSQEHEDTKAWNAAHGVTHQRTPGMQKATHGFYSSKFLRQHWEVLTQEESLNHRATFLQQVETLFQKHRQNGRVIRGLEPSTGDGVDKG